MSKYEMSDDILLELATALREVNTLKPICTIDINDDEKKIAEMTWNQDHIIIKDINNNTEQVVRLVDLDKDSHEFLEACLRLWLVQDDNIACKFPTTRAEA